MKELLFAILLLALPALSFCQNINGANFPPTSWGSTSAPQYSFVADSWASGTITSTTPVTVFTAGAGLYYHVLFIKLIPAANITVSGGGTSTVTFKDNASTISLGVPPVYGPIAALTSLLFSPSFDINLGNYGYKSAATADNLSITLGTALGGSGLYYTIGYCTSPF